MREIKYPLLLDGGLSNVLEEQGFDLNHKLWYAHLLETNPEAIIKAHYDYLKSGAHCITTSSYQSSIPGFMAMGHNRTRAEKFIVKSVQLAEMAIEKAISSRLIDFKPFIAASIGPYGAYLADGSEYRGNYGVSDKILSAFHIDRIALLDKTNADFLAIETIPGFQEAKVLSEILYKVEKPTWISFSFQDDHRINDGTEIEHCLSLLTNHPKVFAIGVNCTAPKYISGIVKRIKASTCDKKIIVYPNSGQAYNAQSKTWLGISDPNLFIKMAKEWMNLGVDIIGGCCRIGPRHIKSLNELLAV
jgi:homocysteine S-methyltransferase